MTGTPVQSRGGNGKFVRDLEHVNRDRLAAQDQATGMSLDEIAQKHGYASRGHASVAIRKVRAEAALYDGTAVELRREQLAEMNELRASLWATVAGPPPLVDRVGRVVHGPDGEVVPDHQALDSARALIVRTNKRIAEIRGSDPPKRSVHLSGSLSVHELAVLLTEVSREDHIAAMQEAARIIADESDRLERENNRAIPGVIEP